MIQFSIVVPVYNVEKYVDECIKSVLNQTFSDYELIIINDGSTDDSLNRCTSYSTDARIRIINKENEGLSIARNTGIKVAKGNYLLFLDSDDYWSDVTFLQQINDIVSKESKPDIIIIGNNNLDNSNGIISKGYIPNEHSCKSSKDKIDIVKDFSFKSSAWDKIVRRDLFKQFNLFFIPKIVGEDFDWCARLLLFANNIITKEKAFYVYRMNRTGSITSKTNDVYCENIIYSLKTCLEYFDRYETTDLNIKKAYFGFLTYFYILILGEVGQSEKNIEYWTELEKYKWVLKYSLTRKSRICRGVYLLLGYRILCKLLSWYFRRRRNRR